MLSSRFSYLRYLINAHCAFIPSCAIIRYLRLIHYFQINKFAGGNCQFSAGIGTKKTVCPDPFMGRLHDPNVNQHEKPKN